MAERQVKFSVGKISMHDCCITVVGLRVLLNIFSLHSLVYYAAEENIRTN